MCQYVSRKYQFSISPWRGLVCLVISFAVIDYRRFIITFKLIVGIRQWYFRKWRFMINASASSPVWVIEGMINYRSSYEYHRSINTPVFIDGLCLSEYRAELSLLHGDAFITKRVAYWFFRKEPAIASLLYMRHWIKWCIGGYYRFQYHYQISVVKPRLWISLCVVIIY